MTTTEEGGQQPTNRKKKVRGGHKAHLTKLLSDASDQIDGYVGDNESRLLTVRSCLERKADIISKLDEEILEDIEDEGEIAKEIEQAENCQNRIREKIIAIDMLIKRDVKKEKPVIRSPPVIQKHNVRLPKLEIEKFCGDPKKYRTFRDSFEAAITKNESLSDVERLTYLRSLLGGEAKRNLEGLAVTNENFKEAVQLLESRYGNKQVIVNSHMEELIKINPVKGKDDTKGLRELYDKVETNLRGLQAFDVDPDSYGCLLIPVMKKKLPGEINLLLSRKFDSNYEVWKIGDVMKELRAELEARERCEIKTVKFSEERQPFTTEGLLTNKRRLSCPYCDKRHFPDKCRIVTNPEKRKEILKQKKRCFVCTKEHHLAHECRAKRSCFRCSGKHHTSICGETRNDRNQEKSEQDFATEASKKVYTTSTVVESKPVVLTTKQGNPDGMENNEKGIGSVLLQTARVKVIDPKTDKKVTCRLILDTGSQRSYITKRLQRAIGLEVTNTEFLSIGAFGGGSTRGKEHDVVEIGINSDTSETIFMRAVVVEKICNTLQDQRISVAKDYEHLKGLQLADKNDGSSVDVEVLVGLDNYWRIVTGEIIRGTSGPVAIHTKFGYILSGPWRSASFMVANEPAVNTSLLVSVNHKTGLREQLQSFWNLESLGIQEEQDLAEKGRRNISFKDQKYEVELPWKQNHVILGDNYTLAKNRLISLLKKLKKSPDTLRRYAEIMDQQLKDGILEKVDETMTTVVGLKRIICPTSP